MSNMAMRRQRGIQMKEDHANKSKSDSPCKIQLLYINIIDATPPPEIPHCSSFSPTSSDEELQFTSDEEDIDHSVQTRQEALYSQSTPEIISRQPDTKICQFGPRPTCERLPTHLRRLGKLKLRNWKENAKTQEDAKDPNLLPYVNILRQGSLMCIEEMSKSEIISYLELPVPNCPFDDIYQTVYEELLESLDDRWNNPRH